jgi:hypothetical protein
MSGGLVGVTGEGLGLADRWRASTGKGWGWRAGGSWSPGENRTGVVRLVLGSGGWLRLSSRAGRRGGSRVGTVVAKKRPVSVRSSPKRRLSVMGRPRVARLLVGHATRGT